MLQRKALCQLLWLQRNFNLSLDSILRVWGKAPNLTLSPKPWCLGKKRIGGDEEAIHDVEEATSCVPPVLGHNFTVISELGNHFLFQPKPQVTLAAVGWETLSTTKPSTHLEFLRAAEGWASVNNNHQTWQSHRNSGEANRDVWPLLPSCEPNQAQRALSGASTGAVGARPVRPWCLGLTPSPWRRAGERGRAHGQGCSTSLHLCSVANSPCPGETCVCPASSQCLQHVLCLRKAKSILQLAQRLPDCASVSQPPFRVKSLISSLTPLFAFLIKEHFPCGTEENVTYRFIAMRGNNNTLTTKTSACEPFAAIFPSAGVAVLLH